MAYTKFSDIGFPKREYAVMCRNMLHDIQTLETQVMIDQEYEEFLKTNGVDPTKIEQNDLGMQVLMSLKTAFWYYSGKDPPYVIPDTSTARREYFVDIFNPLQDTTK